VVGLSLRQRVRHRPTGLHSCHRSHSQKNPLRQLRHAIISSSTIKAPRQLCRIPYNSRVSSAAATDIMLHLPSKAKQSHCRPQHTHGPPLPPSLLHDQPHLQCDPADHSSDRQPSVHSGMEGVKLDVPAAPQTVKPASL